MKQLSKFRHATVAFALTAVALTPAMAQKVSMETATATSVVGLMPQSMAPIWSEAGMGIELAMGQTLTKSLLKLGQGSLDTSVVPPPAFANLKAGKGPYEKLGAEKGAELAGNTTALWGFTASNYHPIVWADSDVKDWSGLKIFIRVLITLNVTMCSALSFSITSKSKCFHTSHSSRLVAFPELGE